MNESCWYLENGECISGIDYDLCDTECQTYKSLLLGFRRSGLPKTQWYPFQLDVPDVDRSSYFRLRQIKEEIDLLVGDGGFNLRLVSENCGNGKTSWGIKLMQAYIEKTHDDYSIGIPAFYVYVPNLLFQYRRCMTNKLQSFEEMIRSIGEADLVFWDDFGSASLKEFDLIIIQSLIEKRILEKKSNIFATNLNDEKFIDNIGVRLYDRIINLSELVEFQAGSMRGENE